VGATVGGGVRAGTGSGVAVLAIVATAVGAADAFGFSVCEGVAVGLDAGVAVGEGDGFGVAVCFGVAVGFGDDVRVGVGVGAGVAVVCACVTAAIGVGVCITTSCVALFAGAGTCRAANAERSAPIPKPAMMTPANNGTIGNPPRSSSSLEERRRRGEPDPELMLSQRSTRRGLALDGRAQCEAKPQAA